MALRVHGRAITPRAHRKARPMRHPSLLGLCYVDTHLPGGQTVGYGGKQQVCVLERRACAARLAPRAAATQAGRQV